MFLAAAKVNFQIPLWKSLTYCNHDVSTSIELSLVALHGKPVAFSPDLHKIRDGAYPNPQFQYGDMDILLRTLDRHSININVRDESNGDTALLLAARGNNSKVNCKS